MKFAASAPLWLAASRRAPADASADSWHAVEMEYTVALPMQGASARLWLPMPARHRETYQLVWREDWDGRATVGMITTDARTGVALFYAGWDRPGVKAVTVRAQVDLRNRQADFSRADESAAASLPGEVCQYLAPSRHVPTDGIVLSTAREATRGAGSPLEKARAIYDWVVEHTFRDPQVQGCGVGDAKSLLESGTLGGKCADISSLFVGLCRAAGIPARTMFGIRVGPSAISPALGAGEDISEAQHCRAEFYLAGTGWIPVDPADVGKVVADGRLSLSDPKVQAIRHRLFGFWEMNWVAFNHARDFTLDSPRPGLALNYFMYPEALVGGVRRESRVPSAFRYRIRARSL
ncbi:MAG: transglutaminase domain-containing protein [Betaproteobacteria bacterium]|nr:transglutaminase domain-containing protein [Betaproteobacteria bacterium]